MARHAAVADLVPIDGGGHLMAIPHIPSGAGARGRTVFGRSECGGRGCRSRLEFGASPRRRRQRPTSSSRSSTSRSSSGLGTAIAARGYLGGPARAELAAALSSYTQTARGLDARAVTFIGTEPIRRAADAARIVAQVARATGAPLHVVTHEEEAFLTLIGVTEGRPVTNELLVVDVGGGSSEFCMVVRDGRARASGVRVGSSRLTDALVDARSADRDRDRDAPRRRSRSDRGSARGEPERDRCRRRDGLESHQGAARDRRRSNADARDGSSEAIRVIASEPAAFAPGAPSRQSARARLLPGRRRDPRGHPRSLSRSNRCTVSDSGVREGTVRVVDTRRRRVARPPEPSSRAAGAR